MRWMKWIVATAVAQLCTFGVVATLIGGCGNTPLNVEREPGQNNPPRVDFMTIEPGRLVSGSPARITARATDPDGDRMEWRLELTTEGIPNGAFQGQLTFEPTAGEGGDVTSNFTPRGTGSALVVLTFSDGRGFTTSRSAIAVGSEPTLRAAGVSRPATAPGSSRPRAARPPARPRPDGPAASR
jgi:hypothetical protein